LAYKFYCTNCGNDIIAANAKIGQKVKCSSCGAEVVVPSDAIEVDGQAANALPVSPAGSQSERKSEDNAGKPVPSFSEALSVSWNTIKANSNVSILALIIFAVVSLATNSIQFMINYNISDYRVSYNPFWMVNWLINFVIGVGLLNIALCYAFDKTATINNFLTTVNKYAKVFVVQLLFVIMLYIGFLLLIVPGIILLVRFQYCTLFVLKYDTGIIDSFKLSARLTEGNRMDLFLFGIIAMLFSLLGFIACGIGIYITAPLATACWAYTFYSLIKAKNFEEKISDYHSI